MSWESETEGRADFISRLVSSTSSKEVKHLFGAWLALTLAFTLLIADPVDDPGVVTRQPELFTLIFVSSFLTAGTAFLFHELAHKVVAQRYGYWAEFRANAQMLMLAVVSGALGFLFAAPGAVHIYGKSGGKAGSDGWITPRESGLISVAGPVTNIALFFIFLIPSLFLTSSAFEVAREGLFGYTGIVPFLIVSSIEFGMFINAFLAAFNMIPAGPLDGKSVYRWNKAVFGVVIGLSVALVIYSFGGIPFLPISF